MKNMTTPHLIITIVFNYFGTPIEMKDSKTRKHEIVQARQFAMFFLRKYTRLSLSESGALFLRDHATVIHASRKIENESLIYSDTRADVKRINNWILANIQIDDFKYAHYDTDLV